jgi:hypothetical protein
MYFPNSRINDNLESTRYYAQISICLESFYEAVRCIAELTPRRSERLLSKREGQQGSAISRSTSFAVADAAEDRSKPKRRKRVLRSAVDSLGRPTFFSEDLPLYLPDRITMVLGAPCSEGPLGLEPET